MWDYYNGLVRVHDFFDCCKPGKVGGKKINLDPFNFREREGSFGKGKRNN